MLEEGKFFACGGKWETLGSSDQNTPGPEISRSKAEMHGNRQETTGRGDLSRRRETREEQRKRRGRGLGCLLAQRDGG